MTAPKPDPMVEGFARFVRDLRVSGPVVDPKVAVSSGRRPMSQTAEDAFSVGLAMSRAQQSSLTTPIVNNDPPCPTMGVTDGENLTPEEIIHRARAEEQAEDIARHPDGFAAKLARRTEQYRKHPERAAFDMLNAEELIRQMQKDAKDLREWVSNLSARVPV